MAKIEIQVTYNAMEEIDKITKVAHNYVDMNESKEKFHNTIQEMFQIAFDEGRKYQKSNKCSELF